MPNATSITRPRSAFSRACRVWFYRAIEPLAPAALAAQHSGDLLSRIVADIETLENFYLRVLIPAALRRSGDGGRLLDPGPL